MSDINIIPDLKLQRKSIAASFEEGAFDEGHLEFSVALDDGETHVYINHIDGDSYIQSEMSLETLKFIKVWSATAVEVLEKNANI